MLAETARRYALRAPRLDAPFLLALLLWAYILYNLTDSGMAIELLERSAVGLPAHRFLMKSLLKAAVFVGCIAGQVGLGVDAGKNPSRDMDVHGREVLTPTEIEVPFRRAEADSDSEE